MSAEALQTPPESSPEERRETRNVEMDRLVSPTLFSDYADFCTANGIDVDDVSGKQVPDLAGHTADFLYDQTITMLERLKESEESATLLGALPLSAEMVRSKLRILYTIYDPAKEDSVRRRNITNLRVNNTPAAFANRAKFPGVALAYSLKHQLQANGSEMGVEALTDVIAAHGMIIGGFAQRAMQLARERQLIR